MRGFHPGGGLASYMEKESREGLTRQERPFSFVALAYASLNKTTARCWQQYYEEINSQVPQVDHKFIQVLEYVAEGQGTRDLRYIYLGETPGFYVRVKLPFGQEGTLEDRPKRHYVYWGNPEKGIEQLEVRLYPGEDKKYLPGETGFMGFEQLRQYTGGPEKLGVNLPSPDSPAIFWKKFEPVFSEYPKILNRLTTEQGQDSGYTKLLIGYEVTRDEVERQALVVMERLASPIRNRIFQLIDTTKMLPLSGFLYFPKYHSGH